MEIDTALIQKIKIPDIPSCPGIYIFYFLKNEKEIPFYAGETKDLRRRIGEYIISNYTSPRDFLVGETIKYIQGNKYKVIVKFKTASNQTAQRRKEEREIINKFEASGLRLLNENVGYNYRIANKAEVLNRIQEEVRILLGK